MNRFVALFGPDQAFFGLVTIPFNGVFPTYIDFGESGIFKMSDPGTGGKFSVPSYKRTANAIAHAKA